MPMSEPVYSDLLKVTPVAPKTRAEITDAMVRTKLDKETDERQAKIRKLRQARLAMEAKTAAAPAKPVAPKKPRARRPKSISG